MFNYAQINDDSVVIGVSSLSGEVSHPNMVAISSYDLSLIGKIYNSVDGVFYDN